MSRLARIVAVLVALACGVLVGRVLWSPLPTDALVAGGLPEILTAGGAGTAAAATVAIGVTAALARRRSITLTTVVTVAGLLLLALPATVDYPSEPAVLLYSNAVAAGLILGAAAPPAARTVSAQAAIAGGMLAAFLLTAGVDGTGVHSGAFGWTAYTPLTSMPQWEPVALVPLWLPVATAALVILAALLDRQTSWTARLDSRLLVAAAALPVVAFAGQWILVDVNASPAVWCGYVAAVVAVVAAIAWRLPGNDGRILVATLAVVAASLGAPSSEPWILVTSAALLAVGLVVGLRFPVPVVGFVLLAAVAAVDLVPGQSWGVVPSIGFAFLLPVAAGYVVGSCLPTSAPAATIGLSMPFTIAVPGAAAAVWGTARYADYEPMPPLRGIESIPVTAAVVALAVIAVCGVGAWGLDLRSRTA